MPAIALAAGGLDAIAAALIAIIFAYALWQLFRPFLSSGLGQLPVVGGFIVRSVDTLLWAVWSAVGGWVSGASEPARTVLDRYYWGEKAFQEQATNIVETTYNAVWHLRFVIVPLFYSYAVGVTQNYYNAAIQAVNTARDWNLAVTQEYYNLAYAFALARSEWNLAVTQDYYNAAVSHSDALYHAAIAHADDWGALLERELAAGEARSIDYTDQWAGRLGRALEEEAARARDYTDARAGQLAQTLVPAIAAVDEAVNAIRDSPCMRVCDTLGGLGSMLQELEEAGLAALLFELAVEGAHDPGGTAREVEGLFGPVVGGTGAELRQAAGF